MKQWKGFITGILVTLLVLGLGGAAFAAVAQKQATLDYNDIKITLNGSAVTPTDANGAAVEPFAIDGTTYLPVRAVANALGLGVEWDGATKTVKLTSEGAAAPAAPSNPGAYSRTNPAPIGTAQSVSLESYSYGKYSVTAVIEESIRGDAAWKKIQAANQFNSPAPEGQEYVLVKLKVTLDSSEQDKAVSFSDFNFVPYSSTSAEYKDVVVVSPDPGFGGSVYAGGTLEGYAVYCVDKTDTAPKLVLGAGYDGSGGIWFSMV
ncbi:stalk domain-containing protein [Pseudoflavonifractor phocaeensis]|uniref:stalk domain-containing protein n=1 Tax=Pseudoflavonifractor phocaeensis TaxID=1870988 RepID=UPI00210E1A75|nr:stalk domain-containing protein [Pseudoflavonifractor phocaeensis]MCQ4866402.1 copper amine oxidase N-terminal domain-containing protein [Pseudoflavonifractor phocaeensis]